MSGWTNAIKYCVRFGDNDITDFSDFNEFFTKKDISFVTNNGNHLLHFLAVCKSNSLLKHVLPYVKNYINFRNKSGETPLLTACSRGTLQTVQTLLNNGAKWKKKDIYGNNILHVAILSENYDIIKYIIKYKKSIIENKNIYNMTPLAIACNQNHTNIIKYLLKHNANIDDLLFSYTKENNYKIIKILLPYTSTNKTKYIDSKNRTPLHYAVQNDYFKIIKLFAQNYISWYYHKDNKGKSPNDIVLSKNNSKLLSLFSNTINTYNQ